jgi:hypothetical protein
MAKLFPSLEDISNLRQKPTVGELHLLNFLNNALDDCYEVYFQPFINGDRPDIILVRPDAGVMIIEVKDWNLKHYKLDQRKNWLVTQNEHNWSKIKSPLSQVMTYKENLYNLHIEHLLEKKINNPKMFAVVTCAIYFHNETKDNLYKFLTTGFEADQKYLKFLNYQEILGYDSLTKLNFMQILRKRYLHQASNLFDENLYRSFKRYLQPPLHTKEEGKSLTYTKKQEELSQSKVGSQKIRGVAGSGKTYVLAKRAVNALKRIQSSQGAQQPSILILTYNITLKNYIHDRISEVKEEFGWKNFYITNYHDFITAELNNLGIVLEIPDDFDEWDSEKRSKYFEDNWYSNLSLFKNSKDHIQRFSVILIDEIQDYLENWVKILRECFLLPHGEYVVFGDEKQNLYNRTMDLDKKPYTGISGNWNLLKESFRLSTEIAELATKFQAFVFQDKYELDTIQVVKQHNLFNSQERIEYIPVDDTSSESIWHLIDEKAKNYQIHPNDISIQSRKIEILRGIDLCARLTGNLKTNTMFESQEIYLKVLMQLNQDNKQLKEKLSLFRSSSIEKQIDLAIQAICFGSISRNVVAVQKLKQQLENQNVDFQKYRLWYQDIHYIFKDLMLDNKKKNRFFNELEKIRKHYKNHFWMNRGTIKLSTIHSFKGWEIDTLFLIVEKGNESEVSGTDELIYTALTRCRHNLFILDCDQSRYAHFFQSVLGI